MHSYTAHRFTVQEAKRPCEIACVIATASADIALLVEAHALSNAIDHSQQPGASLPRALETANGSGAARDDAHDGSCNAQVSQHGTAVCCSCSTLLADDVMVSNETLLCKPTPHQADTAKRLGCSAGEFSACQRPTSHERRAIPCRDTEPSYGKPGQQAPVGQSHGSPVACAEGDSAHC